MSAGKGSDRPTVVPLRPAAAQAPVADDLGDEFAVLREALDDLRLEIRSRFPPRVDLEAEDESDPQAGSPDGGAQRDPLDSDQADEWLALFEELRLRLGSLGMAERTGEIDDFGLDEGVLASARPILDFLRDRYWRIECEGFDRLPAEGPVLFVANRAGLLPYDGLMLAHVLEGRRPAAARPRFLVADWLVTLPFAQPGLARIGGVRACQENARRLLGSGRSVIAFPEGEKGAAKLFRDRYRLQRFGRGGALRLALETGVPIVPIAIAGPEEAHPVLFKSRLAGELLGLPFVPVTPTFPLLGPLGLVPLPTKWVMVAGEALDLGGLGSGDAGDELRMSEATEMLRERVRAGIGRALELRDSVWS